MDFNQFETSIGSKFNKNQTVKFFPGNTIVSLINHKKDIFKYIFKIEEILNSKNASHCFTFLPDNSLHMTTIEGVCDFVRKETHWTSHMNIDTPLVEVDDYFEEQFKKIPKLGNVTMTLEGLHVGSGIIIKLLPKTDEDLKKLNYYRENVSKYLGVRFPDHDSYGYHISLLYGTKKPNENEALELEEVINEAEKYIIDNPFEFTVEEPDLTFFHNMFFFDVNRVIRK